MLWSIRRDDVLHSSALLEHFFDFAVAATNGLPGFAAATFSAVAAGSGCSVDWIESARLTLGAGAR